MALTTTNHFLSSYFTKMQQSELVKQITETLYNENEKRFYRCFIVPKEIQYNKEVEKMLLEIPNFKKVIQNDAHSLWYLFEITPEDYKQRKLLKNKEALETLHNARLDEDLEVTDRYTSDMIDEIIEKRTLKYNK